MALCFFLNILNVFMPPFTKIKKNRRIDMYRFLIDTCGQISINISKSWYHFFPSLVFVWFTWLKWTTVYIGGTYIFDFTSWKTFLHIVTKKSIGICTKLILKVVLHIYGYWYWYKYVIIKILSMVKNVQLFDIFVLKVFKKRKFDF